MTALVTVRVDRRGQRLEKSCPECDRGPLSRNVRRCPSCGYVFVGRQREQRKSMREAGVAGMFSRTKPVRECDDAAFDCIKLPDGRLRLCMGDSEVVLTAEQRRLVEFELREGETA